jgi:hypothetical protein
MQTNNKGAFLCLDEMLRFIQRYVAIPKTDEREPVEKI